MRLCTWPMKSQVKRSPYAACLACEVLGAVLAHPLDAGVGERAEVLERRRTSSPRRSRRRPGRVRARAAARGDPLGARAPVRPATRRPPAGRCAAVAAVPKKRASHIVHSPLSWIASTPAARSRASATALRSTLRPRIASGTSANALAHLVADLVAAAARRRARSRRATDRPRRRRAARRRPRRGRRRRGRASRACTIATAPAARERHRQAVGGQDDRADARDVGGDAVGLRSLAVRRRRPAHDVAAVHLRAPRERRAAGQLAQAARGWPRRPRVVVRALAEVQRRERPLRHAAAARREQHVAPPSRSSRWSPSHSITRPIDAQGDGELRGGVVADRAPSSTRVADGPQAGAELRAARDPGRHEVLAADREPAMAVLREPAPRLAASRSPRPPRPARCRRRGPRPTAARPRGRPRAGPPRRRASAARPT